MNRTEEIGQERVLPNLPENGQLRNSYLFRISDFVLQTPAAIPGNLFLRGSIPSPRRRRKPGPYLAFSADAWAEAVPVGL